MQHRRSRSPIRNPCVRTAARERLSLSFIDPDSNCAMHKGTSGRRWTRLPNATRQTTMYTIVFYVSSKGLASLEPLCRRNCMTQKRIKAVFMRGGTSKAVVFRRSDLPSDPAAWDDIFLAVMGSPDPNGRQLDGMGGGISSLSKICIVGPPSRSDADIDSTFAPIGVPDTF